MKNLTLKTIGITFLILPFIIINILISSYALMNNMPEQYSPIIILGIIVWLVSAIIVSVLIFITINPIEKGLKNLKTLTNNELINISKKALNVNIIIAIIYLFIWLGSATVIYFIFNSKFGNIAALSIWVGGVTGIYTQPVIIYSLISILFSKVNREFSVELNNRKLISNGIKFNIRNKLLLIFTSTITGTMLWLGLFGYYEGVNRMIEEIEYSRYDKLNIISQNISMNFNLDTISKTNIISYTKTINIPKNETLLIADNSGNILSEFTQTEFYENKVKNISTLIKLNNKEKSIYDNINQNVLSFSTINKKYKLILITKIEVSRMNDFWLWFLFYLVIVVIIGGTIAISISAWIGGAAKNINELFVKLKKNNLTGIATKDSEDEFGEIARLYNVFIVQIRELINSIQTNSVSVLSAGNQLSSVSQQISQNANEQAATTEEIATSMEQILAMINSNTQNAEITGHSSEKSANEMKQSNEIFVQTIKSVSEISEKISIISEIASKTDILSINAAIEAARAGEAGKGFAVVAYEIRKLADKTKKASDEITKLSKNGQDISKIAGKKLEIAIPEIIKSSELVNNIVSAGKEQQSGVENINISVQQLTEITNENSASAEEMSASAEELSAQAEQLKELISVFKINEL